MNNDNVNSSTLLQKQEPKIPPLRQTNTKQKLNPSPVGWNPEWISVKTTSLSPSGAFRCLTCVSLTLNGEIRFCTQSFSPRGDWLPSRASFAKSTKCCCVLSSLASAILACRLFTFIVLYYASTSFTGKGPWLVSFRGRQLKEKVAQKEFVFLAYWFFCLFVCFPRVFREKEGSLPVIFIQIKIQSTII